MKKSYKKPYHFYNDVYFENFYFCPGYSAEEFEQAIVKNVGITPRPENLDFDGVRAKCLSVSNWDDGRGGIFIWLRSNKFDAANIGSIAHESYHALMDMFQKRGIKPDTLNDEPGAFLMGWIAFKLASCLEQEGK